MMPRQLPDFQLIESQPSTLNGNPSHILAHKYSNANPGSLQQMAVITLEDGNAYVLGFVREESKFQNYFSIAQYMISTFEVGPFGTDNLPLSLFSPV
jgi:hypothetical protein